MHRTYLFILAMIVLATFLIILYLGHSYYATSLAERFYHPGNQMLKPSGIAGHGFGIIGSLMIIFGVVSYMTRKRYRSLSRIGTLKGWLEVHIFLCTLGPVLILYHTAFKFGGIVAISFWSMVAVFISGVIGRFIYLRIPRTIEGRELSLNEVREMKVELMEKIRDIYQIDEDSFKLISESVEEDAEIIYGNIISRPVRRYLHKRETLSSVRRILDLNKLERDKRKSVLSLVKDELNLNRTISQLDNMHRLFSNWHVAHLPFAMIMLIIMLIHVAVTVVLGYRWIF